MNTTLAGFAMAEGSGAGQFFTPGSIVRLLVEMLEPYQGPHLRSGVWQWWYVCTIHEIHQSSRR
ncbi:MAG: N-6 DNA methylase [Cyclobacteriaceae bacterium]|nr:N-6 DNA methylase [Cyclobacteriaceae bacterium]